MLVGTSHGPEVLLNSSYGRTGINWQISTSGSDCVRSSVNRALKPSFRPLHLSSLIPAFSSLYIHVASVSVSGDTWKYFISWAKGEVGAMAANGLDSIH